MQVLLWQFGSCQAAVQGTEKAMDSSKADAAVAKLQETRAKEKADSKKRCVPRDLSCCSAGQWYARGIAFVMLSKRLVSDG